MKRLSLFALLILLLWGCTNENVTSQEIDTTEEVAVIETVPQIEKADTKVTEPQATGKIHTIIEQIENDENKIDVYTTNFTSLIVNIEFRTDNIEKNIQLITDYLNKYKINSNVKYEKFLLTATTTDSIILFSSYKFNGDSWETENTSWYNDEYSSKYFYNIVKEMDYTITSAFSGESSNNNIEDMSVQIFNYGTYDSANIWIKATLDSDQVDYNSNIIKSYLDDLTKIDITNFNEMAVVFDHNGEYILLVPFNKSGDNLYIANYVICNALYSDQFE